MHVMLERHEEYEGNEESYSVVHITGFVENGFQMEGLPYEDPLF